MNRKKTLTLITVGVTFVLAIGFPLTLTKAQSGHENHGQMNMMQMQKSAGGQAKTEIISLEKIHTQHLPMVLQSIEKAIGDIKTRKTGEALAELLKAKSMITTIDNAVTMHIKPKFVNSKCPIMGSPIDPDKVTEELTRQYKGKKVVFCCNGCPTVWDKLSSAEKDAKLAKVIIKSAEDHAEYNR
jgi:hypothetical protein